MTHHEIQKARWITAPAEFSAPVIERSFSAGSDPSGEIAVSALGFFIVYINGRRIGDEYFRPSGSLFRERDTASFLYPIHDKFTYRCYYSVYDISAFLKEGENKLEIALGDGWYRQTERIAEGDISFGDALGAIYALVIRDGNGTKTISSDGSERCRTSQRTCTQLFLGETYDARNSSFQYADVSLFSLPDTVLCPENAPPDRVIRRIRPTLLSEQNGRKIYDAGENISGFVTLAIRAEKDEEVHIRFSENIDGEELDFGSTGSAYTCACGKRQIMEDIFIGDGSEHIYEPLFVWHAFRYFEITGNAEPVSAAVIHSDTPVTVSFTSDSRELNWLFDAYLRTQLNNMHGGVPSDCPHRERLGYTGDGQICAPAAMLMLDSRSFYRKWIRDIFDSQDTVSGHINHTAPFAGGGGGPGGWGCAAIIVPFEYFRRFGDADPLKEHWDQMKKWIGYLVSHTENGLVVREEEGGWCLGDWVTLEKTEIPEPLVNTCYFIRSLHLMEKMAAVLDRNEDIPGFVSLRKTAEEAVVREYLDERTGSFAKGIQGADAFALFAGLGDRRTAQNLTEKYRTLGYFDTGFLCTDILCGLLFDLNETDVIFDMLSSHKAGSFGYMMDRNATTVWENWTGGHSNDHPMLGACARYLLTHILGIRQKDESFGMHEMQIAPCIPGKLNRASGSITVPAGKICVSWHKTDKDICFEITLPDAFSCDFIFAGKERRLTSGQHTFTESLPR